VVAAGDRKRQTPNPLCGSTNSVSGKLDEHSVEFTRSDETGSPSFETQSTVTTLSLTMMMMTTTLLVIADAIYSVAHGCRVQSTLSVARG